jgi:pentatricopeptide repeat protein
LMEMYGTCDDLPSVLEIVQNLKESKQLDAEAWSIIKSLIQNNLRKSIEYMQVMIDQGVIPDELTYSSVLTSIMQSKNFELGKKIHQHMKDNHIRFTPRVQSLLMEMYGKSNDLPAALAIFQNLKQSKQLDVASWNIIIKSLMQNNEPRKAYEYFHSMIDQGFLPDTTTYSILK